MSDALSPRSGTKRIKTIEQAQVAAYDALVDDGASDVDLEVPHQTRGTWIVPAATDEGRCHVHIDPKTGKTRISWARD